LAEKRGSLEGVRERGFNIRPSVLTGGTEGKTSTKKKGPWRKRALEALFRFRKSLYGPSVGAFTQAPYTEGGLL
jgi:hypothetical protein